MMTLTKLLKVRRDAVVKVIQGSLAGFRIKCWRMRMQIMLGPFSPERSEEHKRDYKSEHNLLYYCQLVNQRCYGNR